MPAGFRTLIGFWLGGMGVPVEVLAPGGLYIFVPGDEQRTLTPSEDRVSTPSESRTNTITY